jgi:hypothetical protein
MCLSVFPGESTYAMADGRKTRLFTVMRVLDPFTPLECSYETCPSGTGFRKQLAATRFQRGWHIWRVQISRGFSTLL